jgi:hypothetical protein
MIPGAARPCGNDGLAGFLVGAHAKRRILRQAVERTPIFSWSLLVLLHRNVDHRVREYHALDDDDLLLDRTGFRRWSRPSLTAAAMSPARTS